MAVVRIKMEITGLRMAAEIVDGYGTKAVDATVVSVEVRHAPALLQLLTTETKKVAGWQLLHDQKLRHLARVSCEADVLLDVVLPLLKSEPRSAVGARLLTRYAWSLRHLGLKVDGLHGVFYAVARGDANSLRRHIHNRTKALPWLSTNLAKLEERIVDLKRTLVVIPKVVGDPKVKDEDSDEDVEEVEVDSDDDAEE